MSGTKLPVQCSVAFNTSSSRVTIPRVVVLGFYSKFFRLVFSLVTDLVTWGFMTFDKKKMS